MKSKSEILEDFALFSVPTGGIGSWLTEKTHDDVFGRLGKVDDEPLPAVQLNQLLVLGHEAPVGDGYFRYYWLQAPERHPYDVRELPRILGRLAPVGRNDCFSGPPQMGLVPALRRRASILRKCAYSVSKPQRLLIGGNRDIFSSKRFDSDAIKR
jgi:hypothetical protein